VVPWSIAAGMVFGVIALALIESMRAAERLARRFATRPYTVAAAGGSLLVALYSVAGTDYAGLGTDTIEVALGAAGGTFALAFLLKIVATSITLETGGSGGIVTPIFFIGATAGSALGDLAGLPHGMMAAFGFVAVLAAAANTPIAAAVMGLELLPGPIGVYAALCAGTAFLLVGHRSVYASQKLGLAKSAGLELPLGGPVGDVRRGDLRVREGTFTRALHDKLSRARVRRGNRSPL